jgi:thiamine-monophosphate kinase
MAGDEYRLIEKYFRRLTAPRTDVVLGIGDDAAVLAAPVGAELVVTTDTLIAGVHFPASASPFDIGWKALAVNLSDIAAMGAEPRWVTLALTMPEADPAFLESFCRGFADCAMPHGVALVGGDLTRGALSITVQAMGAVPAGRAMRRAGARAGDDIWVTGELGGAALGLAIVQGRENSAGRESCVQRLNRPVPRVPAGLALRALATACIDISDGLFTDLGHVLRESGAGARVDLARIPLPAAVAELDADERWLLALGGGDDYELCFTAPAGAGERVHAALETAGVAATCIGVVTAGSCVQWLEGDGRVVDFGPATGYQHF